MGPRTPSNHLRGPIAPLCALSARGVRWPIWPPKGPKQGSRALGWALDGIRWLCLGTESTRATCGVPFPRALPIFTPSTVSFLGPKRPPNGPKWPHTRHKWRWDIHHRSHLSWDGIHLGNVQAALWSCFACSHMV